MARTQAERSTFAETVEKRVRAELAREVRPPPLERLAVKTAVMLTWFYGTYAVLVLADLGAPAAVAVGVLLGLGMAGTLLTIGHERLHHAARISPKSVTYWATAFAAWPMGLNQAWWRAKHNVGHHGGIPDGGRAGEGALDLGTFARLAPDQEWRPWHVAQVAYIPLLFPLHLVLFTVGTLAFSVTGKLEGHRLATPTPRWVARQFIEAVWLPTLLVSIALSQHSWSAVLTVALLAAGVAGTTLSLVLAVEVAHRGVAVVPDAHGREAWASWQMDVSMTVETPHALSVWFVGGLNFHTEHHLFPRAPMYRLGDVSRVVRATCDEFGVPYHVYRSFPVTWWTFLRYLWDLGRRPGLPALKLA